MLDNFHIKRIASGDRLVFKRLHEEFFERFYIYAFSLVHDKEVAEDILQEAFVIYWNKRENFQEILPVKAFFYTIIRHKALQLYRNESLHKRILNELHWDESTPEEHIMMAAEITGQIRQAVATLPPQTQKVIHFSMQDLKVDEIAKEMNISPNTVKMLKKAGYRALRIQLKHLRPLLLYLIF